MSRYPRQKLLFSSTDELMAHHLANILISRGYSVAVRNANLADIALPRILAQIEVWVSEEEYYAARAILENARATGGVEQGSWRCAACGETVEQQFTECWNCGQSRSAR